MKSYGLEMQGPLVIEKVSSLPVWTVESIGRMIFLTTDSFIYISTESGWTKLASGDGINSDFLIRKNLSGIDATVTGIHTIYEVPAGQMFIVDSFQATIESITGLGTLPNVGFGTDIDENYFVPPETLDIDPVAYSHEIWQKPHGPLLQGSKFVFTVSSAATYSFLNLSVTITGYLIPCTDVGPNDPILSVIKNNYIPATEKANPNGVASLDSGGKVPSSQLPVSGLSYKGTWNATTNVPTLSGSGGGGINGDYYIVGVEGHTSIDGHSDWAIGDWIINTAGSLWERIPSGKYPTFLVGIGSNYLYNTIQSAIDAAVAAGFGTSQDNQADILIDSGLYVENLTLHEFINIVGLSEHAPNWSTEVRGSVIFSPTNLAGTSNQIFISGIKIAPITNVSCINITGAAASAIIWLHNCGLYRTTTGAVSNILVNATSATEVSLYLRGSTVHRSAALGAKIIEFTPAVVATTTRLSISETFVGDTSDASTFTGTPIDYPSGIIESIDNCSVEGQVSLGAGVTYASIRDNITLKNVGASVLNIAAGATNVEMVNAVIDTTVTPTVTGAGAFKYAFVYFLNLTGFAGTLNSGAGATAALIDATKNLRFDDSVAGLGTTNAQGAIQQLKVLVDGKLTNVVDDTTPQLGGNLDVNGRLITSAAGADVGIQPDGAGAVNFADKTVKRPYFMDVAEVVSAMGGNAMDMEVANVFTKTSVGAFALTISNPPATGRCGIVTLILTNGGAGVVTWPTNTKWPGGTPPTLVASGVDVIVFMTIDAGTTWRAQLAQGDSK